jgi:hypothetical protein
MLDCGIHPGLSGENSLPFLTNEDLDDIDVCLITHFHLDHCAALPWLLKETTFKARRVGLAACACCCCCCVCGVGGRAHPRAGARGGAQRSHTRRARITHTHARARASHPPQGRIFMTHPTKAIFFNLVSDFAHLASQGGEAALYEREVRWAAAWPRPRVGTWRVVCFLFVSYGRGRRACVRAAVMAARRCWVGRGVWLHQPACPRVVQCVRIPHRVCVCHHLTATLRTWPRRWS